MKRTGLRLFGKRTTILLRLQWRIPLYWCLILAGFAVACLLYVQDPTVWSERLTPYLPASPDGRWLSLMANACLFRWLILAILLASAVSVYGLPIVLATPLLYGGILGFFQCLHYADGGAGVWLALGRVLLPAVIQIPVFLSACSDASRLSASLAGQLLPGASHTGLWPLWRSCMLHFLLYFGLSTVSAAVEAAAYLWF